MTSECPNRQRLSAYTHGELPEAAADAIADHLEGCAACEETVRNLERQGNTLAGLLRTAPAPDRYLDEPQCESSLRALRLGVPVSVLPADPREVSLGAV